MLPGQFRTLAMFLKVKIMLCGHAILLYYRICSNFNMGNILGSSFYFCKEQSNLKLLENQIFSETLPLLKKQKFKVLFRQSVNLYNVFKFTFLQWGKNLIFLVFLLFQCNHHWSENDWDFVSSTLIRSRDFPTNKGKIGFFLRGIVCKRDFHRITFPDQISLNYFLLKLNWKNISFRP